MLACTALVGCSNEDVVNNNEQDVSKVDNAYMAISIKIASDAGSRAVNEHEYVTGSSDENIISTDNSIFLFYDEYGKWITSGVVSTEEADESHTTEIDHSNQVNDQHGQAYVVLQATQTELNNVAQVLAVINYSDIDGLKRLDKNEAIAKVTTTDTDPYTGASVPNGKGAGFLMTTSTYYETGIKNTTAVTKDNIKSTPEEAEEVPVDIYIERASAKVEVAANSAYRVTPENGEEDDKNIVVDGKLTPVYVTIDGWTLNGIVEETYLSKQLLETWGTEATQPFASWNWAENHRSYWAMSRNWNGDKQLTYHSYKEATTLPGNITQYCYENTVNDYKLNWEEGETNHKITTVLLKAHFEIDSDGDKKGDGEQNLYRYSGVYYTENEYMTLILKQLQGVYELQTTTENNTVKADLTSSEITFNITSNKTSIAGVQFDVTLNIPDGAELVCLVDDSDTSDVDETKVAPTAETIAAYINKLAYVTETVGFKNGACFYQVPIEHLHSNLTEEGVLTGVGVVRNHWYKLTVDAVRNIGEAVYDPEKEIDYIPPTVTDYYLAVKLHVLNWHVVKQNVTLN